MAGNPASNKNETRPRQPFVSNHAMVVRVRGAFATAELRSALDRLRDRHPLLIPDAQTNDPVNSHFPLQEVQGAAEADWKEVVKDELRRPFPAEKGPFARFILMRLMDCSDLVAVFHHGVCDGMSGVYVLRDVLRLLGEPTLALPAFPVPSKVFSLIPEAIKNNRAVQRRIAIFLAAFRLNIFFRRLRKRLFPASRKSLPAGGQAAVEGLPPSQRFCILTESLTPGQTAALAARCKAEGTSVHAAVCTAWLRAFANSPEAGKSWTRSAASPISLRNRLLVDETAGMFLATVQTRVNCAPGRDFWEIAREFKQKLNQASTDEKLFMFPLMIGAVFARPPKADMEEILPSLFDRPVKYDFSITNLGRLDIPAKMGALQPEAFYNLVNTSEHEMTVGVNTLAGRMNFSFIFRESKMDPGQAQTLMDQALQQLAEAVPC